MPKELIHFKVAERTADMLGGSRYAPSLKRHRAGLLLGAVFHDALFYAASAKGRPLEALAHRFHGVHGHDTFDLLQLQLAQIGQGRDLAVAVLAGMVSHVFADAAMHPLVWHLTGDYYQADARTRSLARQRHRALEGLMDRVACPEMFGDPRYLLRSLLRECPALLADGLPVAGLATEAGMDRETAHSQIRRAWALYAAVQRGCAMLPLGWALHGLRPVLPDGARELAALFHAPQLMRQAAFLEGEIRYAHPVTGEERRATLDGLVREAAKSAARCCLDLEAAVFDGEEPSLPTPLPSMETAQPGVPAERMRRFASVPFPDLTK
jgi:hypothetical protein